MVLWACAASVTPCSMIPDEAPRQRGLLLLAKAERLLADLGPAIDKIPRNQRYRYAIRLEDALWYLVDLIIQAAASGGPAYRARTWWGSTTTARLTVLLLAK